MKAGDTFLVSLVADEHLWMLISDPAIDSQQVLMVNFTSWKPYHDQACIVDRGDHPYLTRRTCVNYPEARLAADATLEALVAANQVFPKDPLSPQLLRRIRDSARNSRMKLEYVHILVEQGLIE